jgi:hypothetical protein
MTDVNMRAMTDSPTNQDLDAIGKIGQNKCDICGGPDGHMWLHCDSWTKWMRFGCGCNVMHCDNCKDAADARSKELSAANRIKAEAAEVKMLQNMNAGQLARLRSRYIDSFHCDELFRNWVASVVGEEKMKEYLDVPCKTCGKPLGQTKYTFEDKDGNRRLATVDEIEDYCYQVMGRNKETEPFKPAYDSLKSDVRVGAANYHTPEIGFQDPIWDYYERKGWDHDIKQEDFSGPQWKEALNATRGEDCGGNFEWSYGHFIYFLPTKTFLGKMMKRGGDWPQIVQINRKQLEEEQDKLRERLGENYHKHPEFISAYKEIDAKQEWVYFCGKDCAAKMTDQGGTIFL